MSAPSQVEGELFFDPQGRVRPERRPVIHAVVGGLGGSPRRRSMNASRTPFVRVAGGWPRYSVDDHRRVVGVEVRAARLGRVAVGAGGEVVRVLGGAGDVADGPAEIRRPTGRPGGPTPARAIESPSDFIACRPGRRDRVARHQGAVKPGWRSQPPASVKCGPSSRTMVRTPELGRGTPVIGPRRRGRCRGSPGPSARCWTPDRRSSAVVAVQVDARSGRSAHMQIAWPGRGPAVFPL